MSEKRPVTNPDSDTGCLDGVQRCPVDPGEELLTMMLQCDSAKKVYEGATTANGGRAPAIAIGTPSSGFGGEVYLAAGQVVISNQNDACNQVQTLTFELNRLANKQAHLDADATLSTASREDYIRAQEQVGYDVGRATASVVDTCKGAWGCKSTQNRYEWIKGAADFDDYFNNHLANAHKEHFGSQWDRANAP